MACRESGTRCSHLHAFRLDAPQRRFPVYLLPAHAAQLLRPAHAEQQKLQGGTRRQQAIIGVDLSRKLPDLAGIGQGGHMAGHMRAKRPRYASARIRGQPPAGHGTSDSLLSSPRMTCPMYGEMPLSA